ncbi:hypothetical protein [uncultured Ruegeria sp.]|uniref:hypothetical protein n=1 Tax=uncultured Ruegeria sp. TaxID=259304 RepID=UPI0026064AF2|nr:hypothetical protein [uncultured Ruegeria sp.]
MAHTTPVPPSPAIRPGVLFAILLTGAIGFALGQSWPLVSTNGDAPSLTAPEDWHGNVRRSHWSN